MVIPIWESFSLKENLEPLQCARHCFRARWNEDKQGSVLSLKYAKTSRGIRHLSEQWRLNSVQAEMLPHWAPRPWPRGDLRARYTERLLWTATRRTHRSPAGGKEGKVVLGTGNWVFDDPRVGKSRHHSWGLRSHPCMSPGRASKVQGEACWTCVW